MRALIFGAGNIGRGFLGAVLSKNGFDITFVDVDKQRIGDINRIGEYPILIVSGEGTKEENVHHIKGVHFSDTESIVSAVKETDMILTAVGKNALAALAPSLALGLVERIKARPRTEMHVVVIACENVQDNTAYLRGLLRPYIPGEYRNRVDDFMSFPNCVVDRIVPNSAPAVSSENPLAVTVEDYFQFVIDATALRAPMAPLAGVQMSPNLSAVLEQKLFTLNMAHAVAGYFGYIRGYQFIHEAVLDADIKSLLEGALEEVGLTIVWRHKSIALSAQKEYAQKTMKRFMNPHLRDEITRVAREPKRKLGVDDRLVKPALLTWEQGRVPGFLASGIAAALHYDYREDIQARALVREIREEGLERVLRNVSGLPDTHEVSRLVRADFLLRAL